MDDFDLSELDDGMPAVTPAFGKACAEAAAVCLEHNKHNPGVTFAISGLQDVQYALRWLPVTDQSRGCWNDLQDATEFGAYGIAFMVAARCTRFTIIDRARKGTGFDYWLGTTRRSLPFKKRARLEISGILSGDDNDVQQRIREKLAQTDRTDGRYPAYAIVVEYGMPRTKMVQK
jgi:hypothetical protein